MAGALLADPTRAARAAAAADVATGVYAAATELEISSHTKITVFSDLESKLFILYLEISSHKFPITLRPLLADFCAANFPSFSPIVFLCLSSRWLRKISALLPLMRL